MATESGQPNCLSELEQIVRDYIRSVTNGRVLKELAFQ
jgi:hypothetical protein